MLQNLEKKRKQFKRELNEDESTINKALREYKNNATSFSNVVCKQKQKELRSKQGKFQIKYLKYAKELEADLKTLPLCFDKIIIKVAQKENLYRVIDKVTGRIIYSCK